MKNILKKKSAKKPAKKKATKKKVAKKKSPKKPKKEFMLLWACEPMMEEESYFTKRMFGGMAIYLHGKMVMLLTEGPGEREWRGEVYDFEIWNGILYPTSREHHDSLKQDFEGFVDHPVLGKWLYLPMEVDSFETRAMELSEAILANDERLGILPSIKSRKKKSKKKIKKKKA